MKAIASKLSVERPNKYCLCIRQFTNEMVQAFFFVLEVQQVSQEI